MKVLIAGGTGFVGSALARSLNSAGHDVWILTRRTPRRRKEIQWDGYSGASWSEQLSQFDAVVNTTGYGLEHWPWTAQQKRRFLNSRVIPGSALASAVGANQPRPHTFIQISGINYYGAKGEGVADESWPPGDDYLAQLAVRWEQASEAVERSGVRRIVARSAVVLAERGGLFPLMALPVRLGVGGPLGDGSQTVPWIHIDDQVRALRFLLEREDARGAYNLIAPEAVSNAAFMRAVAHSLRRPYWFRTPAVLLRSVLGEMSTLVLDGRRSRPKRLDELGFEFKFPTLELALADIFVGSAEK